MDYERLKANYLIYLTMINKENSNLNLFSSENKGFNDLFELTKLLFETIIPLYGNISEIKDYIYAQMIPTLNDVSDPNSFILFALDFLNYISKQYSSIKLTIPRASYLGASSDIVFFISNYVSWQKNVIGYINTFMGNDEKLNINGYGNSIHDFYFLQAEIHRMYGILLAQARDNIIIIDTTLK